jgi:hypothetical protein
MIATTMNAAISERARLKLAQQTSHRSSVCRDRTRCRQWPKSDQAPVCTENLNPNVVVMKSAQDGVRTYDAESLNRTRDRRILVQ